MRLKWPGREGLNPLTRSTHKYRFNTQQSFDESMVLLDDNMQRRVMEKLKFIKTNPIGNSKKLTHLDKRNPAFRMRRIRVGKYRVFFRHCQECRNESIDKIQRCADCSEHMDNDIILFYVGHRGNCYDGNWNTKEQ